MSGYQIEPGILTSGKDLPSSPVAAIGGVDLAHTRGLPESNFLAAPFIHQIDWDRCRQERQNKGQANNRERIFFLVGSTSI
jgi:hypothetical protein